MELPFQQPSASVSSDLKALYKSVIIIIIIIIICDLYVDCSVHRFGSSANNLGVQKCDMDLFLHIPDDEINPENESVSSSLV